ncbi:MAG: hypothetical protein EA357_03895 [Micavibrio sp.]|nr:MAG: hypothetical protein EA357_03895 [Micavibrio sp.]
MLSAAQKGDKALLEAVKALSYYHPEMAEAIVAEASTIAQGAGMAATVTPAAAAQASAIGSSGMYLSMGGAAILAGAGGALLIAAIDSSSDQIPPPTSSGDPDFVIDVEYAASGGLLPINAHTAYDRSTGGNVITAVLDTGIMPLHPEFHGRIAPNSFDFFAGSGPTAVDLDGHGTHAAGIIAANRDGIGMHGVAYNSLILPLRVFEDGSDNPPNSRLADAVDYAVTTGNAKIINNSWGSDGVFIDDPGLTSQADFNIAFGPLSTSLQNAINIHDAAIVFAAGNESNPEVNALGGMPVLFPALQDNWLVVVAVDGGGTIAGFSNHCGIAQDFCLAAPGVAITSTLPYDLATEDRLVDGQGAMSGTSMAAPHVAGALALLLDEFLGLSVQDAVDILLTTADQSFTGYDADIHGQGMLDLDQAFTGIGISSIPLGFSVSGAGMDSGASLLNTSSVFSNSLTVALQNARLITLDDYNRAFTKSMSGFLAGGHDRFDSRRAFWRFNRSAPQFYNFGTGTVFGFQRIAHGEPGFEESDIRNFHLTTGSGGTHLSAYANAPIRMQFGSAASNKIAAGDIVIDNALGSSYLGLFSDEDNVGFSVRTALAGGKFSVGSVYGRLDTSPLDEDHGKNAVGALAEYDREISAKWRSRLHGGMMLERDSLFGTGGTGAFATGDSSTVFAGLGFDYNIAPSFRLSADYQFGLSSLQTGGASLINGFDNISSDSFSAALIWDKPPFGRDGVFGIALSQPLRVTGGTAEITLPVARDADGNILQDTQHIGLAPSGREINLQSWYNTPLGSFRDSGRDFGELKIGGALRHEPGHIKDASPEALGMFRFSSRF